MQNKSSVLVYVLIIGIGLLAGFEFSSIYEEINSGFSAPEGEVITSDPELESFNQSKDVYNRYATYESTPLKVSDQRYGPWRAIPWRYATPQHTTDSDGTLIVVSNERKEGNAFQITRLPDKEDMKMVMKARDASKILGKDYGNCASSKAFTEVRKWGGDPPPVNMSEGSEKYIREIGDRRNKTVKTEPEKIELEIPNTLAGELVIFFGGVTPAKTDCSNFTRHHLEVQQLYIVAEDKIL